MIIGYLTQTIMTDHRLEKYNQLPSLPSTTYNDICFGEQARIGSDNGERLCCAKPLCHPVLTSPIKQYEHISVNFYLKMQQVYFIFYFFSPAAAATWLSSRGCRLRPASPGLSEKVIQRWPLQASWKIG